MNKNHIREMLPISDDEMIMSVIALEYDTQEPKMPKRKAAEDIVKFF
ncbi:hypothetical protein GH810_14685 [Acetobacterium paludosum]|uniref:Nitroreductase n=1 Tax=Acetobacterium paludosum TaxID=52693 RepID=A0A923HYM4_9FIRM|nr:hypothetical protein [Acetobacterium paludosum]MBC3889557.1 hypothetical protein [Acetobacterium paludosum]